MEAQIKIHNPLVQLAYDAIKSYLEARVRISPPHAYYKILEGKSACFVTLHKKGQLRGCMGSVEYKEVTLGVEIISNAILAATKDPRFPPVTLKELDSLEITVDVLERPRECTKEVLDPAEFGIVLEQGEKRAVMLPNQPGIDTVEKQLESAAKKAGIDLGADYRLFRFKSVRYDKDSVVL
ncbi:MAG: AmmeMemoRadiSam system protein A [bacterium]